MGDCGSGLTQLALYISYQVPDWDYQDHQDYRDDAEDPGTVDLGLPPGRDRAPRNPPTDNPITKPRCGRRAGPYRCRGRHGGRPSRITAVIADSRQTSRSSSYPSTSSHAAFPRTINHPAALLGRIFKVKTYRRKLLDVFQNHSLGNTKSVRHRLGLQMIIGFNHFQNSRSGYQTSSQTGSNAIS